MLFLSYPREHFGKIQKLTRQLSKRNIPFWWDNRALKLATRWDEAIERAINSADYFVVFVSPKLTARQDSFVYRELEIASKQAEKRFYQENWLIPIVINDCDWQNIEIGPRKLGSFHAESFKSASKCADCLAEVWSSNAHQEFVSDEDYQGSISDYFGGFERLGSGQPKLRVPGKRRAWRELFFDIAEARVNLTYNVSPGDRLTFFQINALKTLHHYQGRIVFRPKDESFIVWEEGDDKFRTRVTFGVYGAAKSVWVYDFPCPIINRSVDFELIRVDC
ncbi:MAG: toll/interleukin-1 receptor domain-containing protein [Pseudomonadota bacterium]